MAACGSMELATIFHIHKNEVGYVLRKRSMSDKCKCPVHQPLGFDNISYRAQSGGGLSRFYCCRSININMVSKGIVKGNNVFVNSKSKTFKNFDSCAVIPPPKGKKPSAIIKFLGGAFIGAAPEFTYSYFTDFLANEGFIVISVPYNVTFDHAKGAIDVCERFHICLDTLLTYGFPEANLSAEDLVHLPLYSVGHSNGALLQVLVGSYFSEKIPMANVIVSYNNRPATEAVPYFDQLGPLVRQIMPIVEASPLYSMAMNASGDAQKMLLNMVGAFITENGQESLISLNRFINQLPSVFDQVRQGTSEFKPTPIENQNYFKEAYNVKHTLLVKFNTDPIDETDLLEETLKPRIKSIGGTLEKISLNGNHLTPCVLGPRFDAGNVYTPTDAVAQGIKAFALAETKALSKTISAWFRKFRSQI